MATIEHKLAQTKEKEERNAKIYQDFCDLKEKFPQENVSSIFETLAFRYRAINKRAKRKLYPCTAMGVRVILIRDNKYQPKTTSRENGEPPIQ